MGEFPDEYQRQYAIGYDSPIVSGMKLRLSYFLVVLPLLVSLPANADNSDPAELGWMQGFPPAPDKIIRNDEHGYDFPQRRWSYSHFRDLKPTANVSRGTGPASPLIEAHQALGNVPFTNHDGRILRWDDMLADTYTDGILVMHKGKIIEERYFGVLDAATPHIAMSMSKSFVGTLAAMLVEDGTLSESARVSSYVPELHDSGYGDATLRQVMDMLVNVEYSENYSDPNADVYALTYAAGILIPPPKYAGPDNIYEYLQGVKKGGIHGQAFAYRSSGTDVLAWVMAKATGKSLPTLFSEMIWQKLGAEHDAYNTLDANGTAYAAGGMNTTLRDLARFGEMIRLDGQYNGRQIIAPTIIADIRNGSPVAKLGKDGASYRNMWWIYGDEDGSFSAIGFNGQRLYINPKAEIVIVRYASHHSPSGSRDITPITDAALSAMARHLMKGD
jgi:CubicO group peptidase (beta-lactamase class C family)